FGVVLFLAAVLYASAGVVQAVTGRNILAGRFLRPRTWWLWVFLAGVVGGWAIKMGVGLALGELPIH
ncbi:MAG: hypothetical protein HQ546_01765, partial [Planctomycetes bacterium]|nr:hypothetical protein [Planctomycetota bacterium]